MAAALYTIRKMPNNATLEERLANRSIWEPNTGCLLWEGGANGPPPNHYGTMRWGGKAQKVHRLAWIAARGPVPDGMEVCHKCDMPPCLNVDHLFLGTRADNMADMARKGRSFGMPGVAHPQSKLTEDQVRAIRLDSRGMIRVARAYGVSKSLIWAIRSGRNWRHI